MLVPSPPSLPYAAPCKFKGGPTVFPAWPWGSSVVVAEFFLWGIYRAVRVCLFVFLLLQSVRHGWSSSGPCPLILVLFSIFSLFHALFLVLILFSPNSLYFPFFFPLSLIQLFPPMFWCTNVDVFHWIHLPYLNLSGTHPFNLLYWIYCIKNYRVPKSIFFSVSTPFWSKCFHGVPPDDIKDQKLRIPSKVLVETSIIHKTRYIGYKSRPWDGGLNEPLKI